MATVLDIRQMVEVIRATEDTIDRASQKALLKVTLDAEADAKRNAIKNFTGRNDRTLSGMLLNSIYSGFAKSRGFLEGFVGVQNIPYGAIHEYGSKDLPGGAITPKKAKHLWVKNHRVPSTFKRMTPREFFQARLRDPSRFSIHAAQSGKLVAWAVEPTAKGTGKNAMALFFLLDRVVIPERPYIRPAVQSAWEEFPLIFAQFYAAEVLA